MLLDNFTDRGDAAAAAASGSACARDMTNRAGPALRGSADLAVRNGVAVADPHGVD